MNDKFSELPKSPNCPQLCALSLQRNPTMAPKDEAWEEAKEIHLMNDKFSELPKSLNCPQLCALSLQKNPFVRVIPPSFFQHMPMLQILDLSHTKIRSLPQSLYGLAQLQRLFLRGCKLFMELPPEVGELSNLKVLDLEGTEIVRLPVEVGKLTNLTCLKMSFYEDDNRKDNQHSNRIIPQSVISNLFQLEELIIDVNPDDKRWNANVKDIVEEVCSLDRLEALQLYLPEVLLLNDLINGSSSINLSRMRFRVTVGSHQNRIISRLPLEAAAKFKEQERCLKYVNGEGVQSKIGEVLKHTTALFLDRHSTATRLSEFGIENMGNLKFCVLGECDEIQTIVDADNDDDQDVIFGSQVLGSLEYLNLHYMKNLRSIWKGPFRRGSLSRLKALVLYTCPQLTTIFTLSLIPNLYNLEELVVEDCPKIESIVLTHDPTATQPMLRTGYLFPKLKKISLHYLPKLVNICNGLFISPRLEWMSFYDCPSLKTLSTEVVSSNDLKVIIGEAEWWRELKWNKSEWSRPPNLDAIFVPIELDTDLTTRLAEINDQFQATMHETKPSQQSGDLKRENMGSWEQKNLINELTNGRELAKQLQIYHSVPSSSHDARELLVQKILASYENALSMMSCSGPVGEPQAAAGGGGGGGGGVGIGISESSCLLSGSRRSKDSDEEQEHKDGSRKRKTLPRWTTRVQVSPGRECCLDDGFSWRKYGQKDILGAKYPRSYYRCTHRHVRSCLATKQVQRSYDDPTIFETTYHGRHTCTQVSHQIPPAAALLENHGLMDTKDHQQLNLQPQQNQQQPQEILFSFQSDLEVIMEGLDTPSDQAFPPFCFTSTCNSTVESPEFSPSMMDNNITGNFPTSPISPAASGSSCFSLSPDEMSRLGRNQNLQAP